jgi:hypothetical protein
MAAHGKDFFMSEVVLESESNRRRIAAHDLPECLQPGDPQNRSVAGG